MKTPNRSHRARLILAALAWTLLLTIMGRPTVSLGAPHVSRITVSTPAAATFTNQVSYVVAGTAPANSLVEVWEDGNGNGALDPAETIGVGHQQLKRGGKAFAIAVNLKPGAPNHLVVTATHGKHLGASAAVPVIVQDSQAPAVQLQQPNPASGHCFPEGSITIPDAGHPFTASAADDNGVAGVQFQYRTGGAAWVNAGPVVTAGSPLYTLSSLSSPLVKAGSYEIRAVAIDRAGNTTASAAARVEIAGPDNPITCPASDDGW